MTLKMKSFRPRPHLMRFCLNDAYISMRLGLLSPLIRLAFSSKTQRFEIALESGSKFKRKHIVLVWMVVDGRKRSKSHQNENDDPKYRRRVCLQHRVQLTSNDLLWTVEKASKRNCGSESIDAFSMTTKTHSKCGQGLSFWIQSKETR